MIVLAHVRSGALVKVKTKEVKTELYQNFSENVEISKKIELSYEINFI